jgi:1-aminocyclopropane-1-carboxylate deaminase
MLSLYFMHQELSFKNITVDEIFIPSDFINHTGHRNDIRLSVLRLDKIHPLISGNKWFKLRFYLEDAINKRRNTIVTFGGAWSNHIVATAAICKQHSLQCVGIIRGEEPVTLSNTLTIAKQMGMQLLFVSREDYRKKELPVSLVKDNIYVIDEGGYGTIGAKGASSVLDFAGRQFTHYCCATGTGTMLAGLINAMQPGQEVIGISVLKNNHELHERVTALIDRDHIDWQLLHDYHFGGYAKHQPSLLRFMNDFFESTKIPSDFVYTGKLFYAVTDLIDKGFFAAGSDILIVHSGGLQGNQSLDKGTLIF